MFNQNLRRLVTEESGMSTIALQVIAEYIARDYENQQVDVQKWLDSIESESWSWDYSWRSYHIASHFAHAVTLPSPYTDFWDEERTETIWMGPERGSVQFSGSIAKRVSKFVHKVYNFKLSKHAVTNIGNAVYEHKPAPVTFYYNYTQDFDWARGEFNDPESCFFTCRNYARRILRDMGAWVCQLWGGPETSLPPKLRNARDREVIKSAGTHKGIGRFYLLPIAETNMCVAFNWYRPRIMGNWSLEEVIKIIRNDFPDADYDPIQLDFDGADDGMVFVNNGEGLLIALDGKLTSPTRIRFSPMVRAASADYLSIDSYEYLEIPDGYCSYKCCGACGKNLDEDEDGTVAVLNELGVYINGPSYHTRYYSVCTDCYVKGYTLWDTPAPKDGKKQAKIMPISGVMDLCS